MATKKKPISSQKKWSARVTAQSDAVDLPHAIFKQSASVIARSLKHAAEKSPRRQSTPFRSAMSMLTFYENRAGQNLSLRERKKLEAAKRSLRKVFDKENA